ncbi:hypothetical protein OG563_06190 [Nocardia vinacea]|uniref:Uncharacterized protein n=1 Tax=Nocardia vinacea TaxID=96468 RepID=A0ABZ1YX03_9NOCA|nr:hypothetical protein [Nocardia vinacea]
MGTAIAPGLGTAAGAALGAALVGGVGTGFQTDWDWDKVGTAALVDGVFGALGGGMLGGAVQGFAMGAGSRMAMAAAGSISAAETGWIAGAGIGSAVASHFTAQGTEQQKIPDILPTRPAGEEYRRDNASDSMMADDSSSGDSVLAPGEPSTHVAV